MPERKGQDGRKREKGRYMDLGKDPNARRQILEYARELIDYDGFWTQEHHALDVDLKPVPPDWPTAVCFDMVGAVERSIHQYQLSPQCRDPLLEWILDNAPEIRELAKANGGEKEGAVMNITDYNDHPNRTHAKILITMVRLIRMSREETARMRDRKRTGEESQGGNR